MKKTLLAVLLLAFIGNALAALPEMPIKVTYRKALLNDGYVLQFHNISESIIPIKVTLENPQTETTNVFRLNVDAFKLKEIGSVQGWTALPGDKITVENADFQTLRAEIKK